MLQSLIRIRVSRPLSKMLMGLWASLFSGYPEFLRHLEFVRSLYHPPELEQYEVK